jgi:hypothetical protein
VTLCEWETDPNFVAFVLESNVVFKVDCLNRPGILAYLMPRNCHTSLSVEEIGCTSPSKVVLRVEW